VEKGKQGYKVASIQDGVVPSLSVDHWQAHQEEQTTQVMRFIFNLAGKCVEGMQMNWVSYLINELEKYCHEV
jgi:hypothetical protein